jgi:hypothetical protein
MRLRPLPSHAWLVAWMLDPTVFSHPPKRPTNPTIPFLLLLVQYVGQGGTLVATASVLSAFAGPDGFVGVTAATGAACVTVPAGSTVYVSNGRCNQMQASLVNGADPRHVPEPIVPTSVASGLLPPPPPPPLPPCRPPRTPSIP